MVSRNTASKYFLLNGKSHRLLLHGVINITVRDNNNARVMGKMEEIEDNTPPRSPEMSDNFDLDQADILEVIELDDAFDEDMMTEERTSGDDDDEEEDDSQGAIIPERDDAKVVFKMHKDSVLSCAFHPTKPNVVVTGGMDDKIFVWDASSDEPRVLFEASAEESVDCVKFSHYGQYLAAADVDGAIKVYDGNDFKSFQSVIELGDDFKWLLWHPLAPVIVAASNSLVSMYSIPSMVTKVLAFSPHGLLACGKIFPDGKRLACGTREGGVRVIDMKSATVVSTIDVTPKHGDETCGVYCLDVHRDGAVVVCGCDRGAIFLVNADTGKFSVFPTVTDVTEDVEVIEYGKAEQYKNLAVSAHRSGALRIWDTTRQALRCEYQCGAALVGMQWHPSEPLVFTCHSDARVLMVDVRSGLLLRTFLGHSRMILAIDISPDTSSIVTVSDDYTARIFSTKEESSGMEVAS